MSASAQSLGDLTVLRVNTGRPPAHRDEILCVQALRGIAVLLVLGVHIEDMANRIPQFSHFQSFYSQRIGYSGPDLFFVISGFIMSYITFGMPFRPKQWLINRFVRIYPMSFLYTSLALLIFLWRPDQPVMGSGPHNAWTIIQSFLVLPQRNLPLLFVGWTLQHEVVFYTIVFVVACTAGPKILVRALAVLSVLAMARWVLVNRFGVPDWDWTVPSLFLLEFLMGALIFRFRDQSRRLRIWPAALLALLFFVAGVMFADSSPLGEEQPVRILLFGGAYTFLLVASLNQEERLKANRELDPTRRSFFVQLGDASYSMYLCHPFVLAAFGHAGRWLNLSGMMAYLWLPLAYACVIACGLVLYPTLEKPSITLFRRLLLPKPA